MASAKPFPLQYSNPKGSLDEIAAAFALRDQAEAEEMIESLCAEAVRQWRLNDATFWHRVKFRSRLLRKKNAPRADTGPTHYHHDRRK